MNCPECNSEKIIEGSFQSMYGVIFVEKGTEMKLRPNYYRLSCKVCEDCGKLFDIRAKKNKTLVNRQISKD